jgi:hypothetical protein
MLQAVKRYRQWNHSSGNGTAREGGISARPSLYPPPCAGESSRAADRFDTPSPTA